MSFSDPITVTVNAVEKTLPRIREDKYSSEYYLREATGEYRLNIRNTSFTNASKALIDRHNFELIYTLYEVVGVSAARTSKIYTIFENERTDTSAVPLQVFLGLAGFMTSPNMTKAMNYES